MSATCDVVNIPSSFLLSIQKVAAVDLYRIATVRYIQFAYLIIMGSYFFCCITNGQALANASHVEILRIELCALLFFFRFTY